MLASDIIDRARLVLNDLDSVRWTDAELLKWINDGQRIVATVKIDASVSNETMNLVAGTKQTLPSNALRLLDVVCNIDGSGNSGRAVRPVDRQILDEQTPGWHSSSQSDTIYNWVYDNRDPLHFYVYPPAKSTAKLAVKLAVKPTDVSSTSSSLSVLDTYVDPIFNFVLSRAYAKDAEFSANAELSAAYLQVAQGLLGLKAQKDVAYSPDMNSRGKTTPSAGTAMGGA